MFENRKVGIGPYGIYYSRFIASWYGVGGPNIHSHKDMFMKWLTESVIIDDEHITEEVADEIYGMATCGKLELECNAKIFLKNYKQTESE